ncbi:MAG: glycosyltransferase [Lachnospiraceae bacterium]|jgi:glycosyltransferase involved in cell wall biosynthesis|nr:glycosyltransferase [Lachnospiraceae bacterium]
MNNNPLISIIIPHYNTPALLKRLLDSIGFHEDVQIIVIDDNSTKDISLYQAVQKEYQSDHTIFLKNDSGKKGAGAARNIGLEYAEGQWVMFADSDDAFLETWYDTVLPFTGMAYDAVYFAPKSVSLDGVNPSERGAYLTDLCASYLSGDNSVSEMDVRSKFSVPWSKLIRHQLIREHHIRFDPVMHANDVMFSSKVGCFAKTIQVVSDPIYCLCDTSSSLTANVSEKAFYVRTEVFCDYYRFWSSHGLYFDAQPLERLQYVFKNFGVRYVPKYMRLFRKNGIHLLTRRMLKLSKIRRLMERR